MIKESTNINGCYVLTPKVFGDDRGYFFESYNKKEFEKIGINDNFIQDNESLSAKNILRGLHYQIGDSAMSKLRRVAKGKVLDICVDMRKESSTFGKYHCVILSGENKKMHYIPRGCAAGLLTLEDNTLFVYKCDNLYSQKDERGVFWNDSDINLPLLDYINNLDDIITSDKDKTQPLLKNATYF